MNGHHIGVIASSIQTSVATWTNLESWFKFDETSGNAADSEGSYSISWTGTPTQATTGITFDGSTQYGNGTWMDAPDTDDFTVIMCIYPDSGYTTSRVICGGNSAAFGIVINSDYEIFIIQDDITTSSSTTLTLTSNAWNMLAVSRDGTDMRVCINGDFETIEYTGLAASSFTGTSNDIATDRSASYDYLDGKLKDLAIFSDAKSDTYITAFYNSGSYTDYEDGDPA